MAEKTKDEMQVILNEALEKIISIVEDIQEKAVDGITGGEALQLALSSSDEVVWLLMNKENLKQAIGDRTKEDDEVLINTIIESYDAPTPEFEYMVESIVVWIFATEDTVKAVIDFINSRK